MNFPLLLKVSTDDLPKLPLVVKTLDSSAELINKIKVNIDLY